MTTYTPEQIEEKKAEIIKSYGEWTAERIKLHDNIYTKQKDETVAPNALHRTLQIIQDNAPAPLESLRILDLGSLEGGYSIELGLHGARVVGVEGREINIEKARFAQEVLGLDNVEFVQDDVRNLSVEKYGQFDVVLCSGILYHLDFPDIVHFMRRVFEVCKHFAVIDTLTSLFDKESITCEGHTYWGQRWAEFRQDASEEEKAKEAWSSLDNATSFCLTHPSLFNLLKHAGFTSVYECHIPADLTKFKDRITLLARRGGPVDIRILPEATNINAEDWPERLEKQIGAGFNKVDEPTSVPPRNPLRRLVSKLK